MIQIKLYRDRVISIVRGKDLVGVYVKIDKKVLYGNYEEDGFIPRGTQILLGEMSPEKADKIIKLWNSK